MRQASAAVLLLALPLGALGPTPSRLAPTAGRALDHIGFEVDDLRELCRRLERAGVVLDRGYTEVPSMGIAIAFFTDPWGTYVELTEGLAAAGRR